MPIGNASDRIKNADARLGLKADALVFDYKGDYRPATVLQELINDFQPS